ncbi:MAG: hypothetical protein ACUVS4_06030 [Chloroflexaceae bacterium]
MVQQHTAAVGDWLLRYLPGPLLVAPLLALAMRGLRQAAPDNPPDHVSRRPADGYARSAQGVALFPKSATPNPFRACQTASARLSAVAGRAAPALRSGEAAEEGTDGATPTTSRLTAFLLLAGLAIIASFVLIGSALYSRYLLPAWPPLLLAAALGTTTLWSSGRTPRGVALLTLLAATGWSLVWIGWFTTAPLTAPLADQDRKQYLETWSAGHNLDTILADIRATAAAHGHLTLVNHNQPRLVHLATLLYLRDTPTIRLTEEDLSTPDAPAHLADLARNEALLLAVDEQEVEVFALRERFPRLQLLRRYSHPNGAMAFLLFEQQP